jgi:hypothetical protein
LLVTLALSACGSGTKTIDTATLVRVLKDAGFRNTVLVSNKANLNKLAREFHRPDLAKNPLDEDGILTRGYDNPLAMPLTAVRFPSIEAAARRVQSDQPLLRGTLSREERRLLPRGYDADRLNEIRICNVVLTSYNPSRNRTLDMHFRDAASRLRQRC